MGTIDGKVAEVKKEKPKLKPKVAKKSRVKFLLIIIIALVVIAAIAVLVLGVMKNLFGIRNSMMNFLGSMDPNYVTVEAQDASLKKREQSVTDREKAVKEQEDGLKDKEKELDTREKNVGNGTFAEYIAGFSNEHISQLQQLASVYSNMDAKAAAAALSKLGNVEDMAVVINYMKDQNAAALMNNLDADTAAKITEYILG